LVELMKIE